MPMLMQFLPLSSPSLPLSSTYVHLLLPPSLLSSHSLPLTPSHSLSPCLPLSPLPSPPSPSVPSTLPPSPSVPSTLPPSLPPPLSPPLPLSLPPSLPLPSPPSDLTIMLSDRTLCGHKFVLVARSRHWCNKDETLSSTTQLDLSNMTPFLAVSLIRWVYTDMIVLPTNQDAVIELLAASNRYQLTPLKEK